MAAPFQKKRVPWNLRDPSTKPESWQRKRHFSLRHRRKSVERRAL